MAVFPSFEKASEKFDGSKVFCIFAVEGKNEETENRINRGGVFYKI